MKTKVIEEQLNNLDGATLEIGYNEEAKSHLLALFPEKKGDVVSIWVDRDLKNKMMDALTLQKLDENDVFLLEQLKKLVQRCKGNLIVALGYAKEDVPFSTVWMETKNKNLIIQKLATWALEQEETE
ncbi:hypothetical protein HB943_02095 [Listeria weihenstephanensis]|uniref:Uncharacterized protein n=1 Tax=Listeria weihenstephanensis TaxID=1006155 RepID=A0A841Z2F9_9LIST|nr:hypothetical protein [Listeria weihenstephanensis]MBC1499378.1 hypothetical protein [Listeria weihenstephanensis]